MATNRTIEPHTRRWRFFLTSALIVSCLTVGANAGDAQGEVAPKSSSHAGKVVGNRPPSVVPVVVPTNKWAAKHEALVQRAHEGGVDILFLGDSITEGMNKEIMQRVFGPNAASFGVSGDRTQHLLWRLHNGELDFHGKQPRLAIVLIGVNNFGTWQDLPRSSDDEIYLGVKANVKEIRKRLRHTKILVLGILPCDQTAEGVNRVRVKDINEKLKTLADDKSIWYADIGPAFLEHDGTISTKVMSDFLHPTHDVGYEVMFGAIKPHVDQILNGK